MKERLAWIHVIFSKIGVMRASANDFIRLPIPRLLMRMAWLSVIGLGLSTGLPNLAAAQIVALGASQTYGNWVSREEAYPSQLELLLHAKGLQVSVSNQGISGDTTGGMLIRLDSAVPNGTKVVILQPGSNDKRHRGTDRDGNIEQISNILAQRKIKVILMENSYFKGAERGADGQHLTPAGYHKLAEQMLPLVIQALRSK